MKKARVLFITLLFVIAMTGRAQESSPVGEVPGLTNITWKLIGLGTVGEDTVQKVEPQDSVEWKRKWEYIYTILFLDDGHFWGKTFNGDILGEYSLVDGNIKVVRCAPESKVGDRYYGNNYWETVSMVEGHKIENGQLILYYNNRQNYLLYRKSKHKPRLLVEGRRWVYRDSWPDYESQTEEQKAKGEVPYKTAIHSLYVSGYLYETSLDVCRYVLDMVDGVTDTVACARELFFKEFDEIDFKLFEDDFFHQKIRCPSHGCEWSFLFGKHSNESYSVLPSTDYVQVRADSIEVNGRRFAREIWKLGDDEIPIVEGVGCPTGLLVFEDTDNGCKTEFLGCYDGDELVFSPEDFYRPAVSAGISTVTLSPSPQDQQLFDLQGRRLAAPPAKGLYIQGGRLKLGHSLTRFYTVE